MTTPESAQCHVTDAQQQAFARMMLRDSHQYGVVFYDRDLIIRGWSSGAVFITGWTAEELIGKSTSILFVPEDRERKLHEHEMASVVAAGMGEDERWHERRDGSRFWSSGMSMLLDPDAGLDGGLVKIFRDATHLRARIRYLENALNDSTGSLTRRECLLATVAHEMRNPLAPLRTATELLRLITRGLERAEQPLQIMERQQSLLERLVEDLVDVSRIHTGKMSLAYQEVDLRQMIGEAVDSLRPRCQAAGIELRAVWPSVDIMVEVDPARLQQVLANLMTNAVKFNRPGGSVSLNATVDQTHIVIYLKDTGRGIAPDLLPRIFDVFTQADGSSSERGAGLGVGLAVVKEIVNLHHGTIEVRSEGPGKGAEFIVRLPQRRAPHWPAEPPPPDSEELASLPAAG
ncbi:MAG: ATP-binding protein [Gammaproteobacteria bacterium]